MKKSMKLAALIALFAVVMPIATKNHTAQLYASGAAESPKKEPVETVVVGTADC